MNSEQAKLLLNLMVEAAELVKEGNDGEYGGRTVWDFTSPSAVEEFKEKFNKLAEDNLIT